MPTTTALVPLSADKLGGPFATVTDGFTVLAHRDKALIVEFHQRPAGVTWFEEFAYLYCREQHEPGTFKVIREATDDERRRMRVPLWIQNPEPPECCGRPMAFVGQIDDDRLCTERPKDAKKWWHDAASFYVFTCPICLECKASGSSFRTKAAADSIIQPPMDYTQHPAVRTNPAPTAGSPSRRIIWAGSWSKSPPGRPRKPSG